MLRDRCRVSVIAMLVVVGSLLGNGVSGTEAAEPKATMTAEGHRLLQPVQRPVIPELGEDALASWRRNPVDRFTYARMREHGLTPSPQADSYALIRRVTFDLTGLPPTPKEIDSFVRDESPDRFDRLIDRLLSSQQYGERWGQHWLDVVGYADSNGYWATDSRRPLAYKYRDYVIESLNRNKPFDQFMEEQIAGDEKVGYIYGGDLTADMVEALIATHFLRNAADGTGESDGNPDEVVRDQYFALEGTVEILGSTVLGITVQCARCHDHKFEPLTSEEYYQLQAILKPAYDHDEWLKPNERVVQVGLIGEREANKELWDRYNREAEALKKSLEGLMKPYRELAIGENLAGLSEQLREEILAARATAPKKRTTEMKALIEEHADRLAVDDDVLFARFAGLRSAHDSIRTSMESHKKAQPPKLPELAIVTDFSSDPAPHHLLDRGDYQAPTKPVESGTPASLSHGGNVYRVESGASVDAGRRPSTGRRLAFVRWLTDPQNPTFARLMVNRVWLHYFGQGIVSTPGNFGVTGAPPTHPLLLDFLAAEFIESWDLKKIHRLILTSSTYQQASRQRSAAYEVDPETRFLWRYPLRRLDAEAVRDAMLFVSGELDRMPGGPFVPTQRMEDGRVVVESGVEGANRRSIYLQKRRTQPLTLLELFDQPVVTPNCIQRKSSTVVLQPLAQLNSEFARARSRAFAFRVLALESDITERIRRAFLRACGRWPQPFQIEESMRFLRTQREFYGAEDQPEVAIWTDFCQMLLASNGFLYLK